MKRDIALVTEEYDRVYKPLLDAYKANPSMSIDEMEARSWGMNLSRTRTMSRDDKLFDGTVGEAALLSDAVVLSAFRDVKKHLRGLAFGAIVDLGAGFGHDLHVLSRQFHPASIRYIGGEANVHGVELGNGIYGRDITMHRFDYYNPDAYKAIIPNDVPTVVMTHHSIEQIPRYKPVLEGILSCESVIEVVHMEPIEDNSPWAEKYDYNTDLVACLKGDDRVRLIDVRKNVFGVNPVNPTSIVWWWPRWAPMRA